MAAIPLDAMVDYVSLYLSSSDVVELAQCAPAVLALLQDKMIVRRLLWHARVRHASHLVAEAYLPVETQMSLAVVNHSFYCHALVFWRTQTLDKQEVGDLRRVYVEHLDINLLGQSARCLACDINVLHFLDAVDRRSYHRIGVCRPCRNALQSDRPHHQRMWQCGRLSDYGLYFVELWLQICQPMNCMRFQNLAELENARMFASRRMEPPDAFRLSVFELSRRRFYYPDAAWPSVAWQKNPCVCFYWRRMGKDVCVCTDRTWPLACRPHSVWASSSRKKAFAVFFFLWVWNCHETLE